VNVIDGTIPHRIDGVYGAGKIVMLPARAGTGLIAGGPVRAIMEVVGIRNIVAKSLGSRNPFNTVRATIDGLMKLKDTRTTVGGTVKKEEEPQEKANENA